MPKTTKEGSGRRIQSVEIAFNIIDMLQQCGQLNVTELANELDHSKSTVYSHLQTLKEREILVQESDGYRLSLKILDMATSVREQVGNYDVIKTEVDKLSETTDEIAQFGIEEHGKISYLYKATGEQAVETRSRIGTQAPLFSTSLGQTILAYIPSERREEIIEATEFEARTPNTVSGPEELSAELDKILDRGYAIDDEENIEGLRCVAAPVNDGDTVLGAISITGPSSRFTEDRIHGELSDSVQRAANVIELNTKFS